MRISQLLFMLLCAITCIAQRSDFQEIDFTKADSIALKYKGASLKNIPVLTHNLTSSLQTDVEKIRAIYTWIGTNIENDYSSYLKISHKRKRLAKRWDKAALSSITLPCSRWSFNRSNRCNWKILRKMPASG